MIGMTLSTIFNLNTMFKYVLVYLVEFYTSNTVISSVTYWNLGNYYNKFLLTLNVSSLLVVEILGFGKFIVML